MLLGFVRMDSDGMSLNFGIAYFFRFLLNLCVLSLLHFGCSTAVEHMLCDREVVGSNPAGC